jgi:AcrR family transcriptional regulator
MGTGVVRRVRNPRGQGGRLRRDILAAGFAVLDEGGSIKAVTLRAVARAAGVTAPAIYGHFASVTELLAAMRDATFAEMLERTARAAAKASDPVSALLARASAYVELGMAAPARRRLMFAMIPGIRCEVGLAAFEVLVEAVRACVEVGRSASTDPWTDTTHLLAALDGLVLGRTALAGFPWPPLEETVRTMTVRLIRLTGFTGT